MERVVRGYVLHADLYGRGCVVRAEGRDFYLTFPGNEWTPNLNPGDGVLRETRFTKEAGVAGVVVSIRPAPEDA